MAFFFNMEMILGFSLVQKYCMYFKPKKFQRRVNTITLDILDSNIPTLRQDGFELTFFMIQ